MNEHKSRDQSIDALRGFALFGILLVNVFVFHAPYAFYGQFYTAFQGLELLLVDLVVEFASGKFLFIFAFLFGYGFWLQQKSRGDQFPNYHFKRMMVLFVFGLIHTLLFWFGDILASYALLGLLLLLLLKLRMRLLLLLGIFLLYFRPFYYIGVALLDWPQVAVIQPVPLEEFISTFQSGTFMEIFELRMLESDAFIPESLVWYLPKTLGLMLLGFYSGHMQLFDKIRAEGRRVLLISSSLFLLFVCWYMVKADFFAGFDLKAQPAIRPLLIAINVSMETALGFAYVLGFAWIFDQSQQLRRLFALSGRMALSNYILQSVFCVGIFYSYGLGLYGKLQPSDLILITFLVFGINLLFSWFWLKRFKQGPLEYLWRKLIS